MSSEFSPTDDKDAEPNWQFPFGCDLNKILITRLTQVKNKGREAWYTIFTAAS